ncbi:hypothetical protein C9412_13615 [Stenotrophomonas sp. Nf1]|nr:hypothetical protein C9412_13615 [Stenotrophomonas sp. Nf1]PTA83046.1 hypothetical protein C9416_00170 [Stenotrophomonas sp. Nf4]
MEVAGSAAGAAGVAGALASIGGGASAAGAAGGAGCEQAASIRVGINTAIVRIRGLHRIESPMVAPGHARRVRAS